ncbi:MAG: hypothetical protein V4438_00965 [Patescibacteria group bacterium]
MSVQDFIKAIKIELAELNAIIDLKVIRGLSYKNEAKIHKQLKIQLQQLHA